METFEKLKTYFESARGRGVLATADSEGRVDAAMYSRPHFMEDETVALIMRDRLTHLNMQSNPYAVYLFMEDGPAYKGKRLFLRKLREEKDTDLLYELRRRAHGDEKDPNDPRFLVFFKVEKVLPLVGVGEEPVGEPKG